MSVREYIAVPREIKALPNTFPVSDYDSGGKDSGLFHHVYEKHEKQLDGYVYYPPGKKTGACDNLFGEGFGVSFQEKGRAVFSDFFKNPFVYKFHRGKFVGYTKQLSEMLMEQKWQGIKQLSNELGTYMRQMLYESLDVILDVGEFAEICSIFIDHVNYDFGPPTSECVINLSDILTVNGILDVPADAPLDYRHKTTIIKR